ncbi:MAG TPA: glycosyltransferase family 39 protein [bacterium]|nr:glycosyltransferase family 39 protein [bacterium]
MSAPDGASPLRRRRELLLLGLVLLFAAGLFTFRLGAGSLWDLDEPRYAQASREILATGDPVTMHLDGSAWFGPPPLWMWLQAGTGWAFGFTEFTARVWAALFGVLGVGVTCLLGWEWFGPRTGVLSGLILASTLEYVLLSRLAVLDVVEVAFLLLAVHAFYRGYRDRRRADYLRSFLFAGLATLTRGPVTLMLLAAVFVPFLAYRRALRRWREIPWGWGGLIYLAIAAPWYVAEAVRGGAGFLGTAFGGPWLRPVQPRVGALLYDVPVLVLGAVPWAAFFPGAFVYHYLRRWQDGSLLCLLWCGVTFVGVVVIGGRLPDDVFPIFPFSAIAIARLWEEFLFEGAGRLRRTLMTSFFLQIGVVALLALAVAALVTVRYPRAFEAVRVVLIVPLAVLVGGPALTAVLFRLGRYTGAFLTLPATMAVFVGVLYTVTLPVVERQKPIRPLAIELGQRLTPGDRVIGYRIGTPASLIYYANHPVVWINDPETLRERLCAPGRAFLITTPAELAGSASRVAEPLQPVGARGDLIVREKPAGVLCGGSS